MRSVFRALWHSRTTPRDITNTRKGGFYLCFRIFGLCGWAVLPAAEPGAAQEDADRSPLVTWEDLLPARRGAVLWVKNPSADSVWLDSLHVESCLNIRRSGCRTRPLGLVLPPGASKELHRLEPAVPRDAFSYRWYLDWRILKADSAGPPIQRRERPKSKVIRT